MGLEGLARSIRSSFRLFRLHAESGREKFGNYVRTFANAIRPQYVGFYGDLAKDPKTREAVEIAIEQRSLDTAASVLDTSRERLENGSDPREVFSTARAADIALTESVWAMSSAKMLRVKQRGKRLMWVADGSPCPRCKFLDGKVVKPGQYFRAKDGTRVLHPGLHPHCRCKTKEVA